MAKSRVRRGASKVRKAVGGRRRYRTSPGQTTRNVRSKTRRGKTRAKVRRAASRLGEHGVGTSARRKLGGKRLKGRGTGRVYGRGASGRARKRLRR